MKTIAIIATVLAILFYSPAVSSQQKKIKVIADQDSAGPQGTNFLSLLMLLRAKQVDLLGITTVSGDQWVEPATVFALWATEITKRTDVPVIKGAEMPPCEYVTRAGTSRGAVWVLYRLARVVQSGCSQAERDLGAAGGFPKTKPKPGRAADFIIDTIRANPGEVVLYCAGPLTNIALAVRMDPGIVVLTKAIYIMGGSSAGGPELNWWWDPEAAAIAMREPWKEIVVTPFEIGEQVWSSERLMKEVVKTGGLLASYVKQVYLDTPAPAGTSMWSMMWDELTVASIIDPTVIKKSEEMYLDVDIEHGPNYGHTVVWKRVNDVPEFFLAYSGPRSVDREKWLGHLRPPAHLHAASVQMEADVAKFEKIFIGLMSH